MNKWFYYLSQQQLDQIYFICDDQQEFDKWFGQDPTLSKSAIEDFGDQF